MNDVTALHHDVKGILEQARGKARSAVNAAMVEAYWLIGQRIVQEEQLGQHKAQYGKRLMEDLSAALTADFGKGFSYANLYNCRQFYLTFPEQTILYTVCRELSWSHLRLIQHRNQPLLYRSGVLQLLAEVLCHYRPENRKAQPSRYWTDGYVCTHV